MGCGHPRLWTELHYDWDLLGPVCHGGIPQSEVEALATSPIDAVRMDTLVTCKKAAQFALHVRMRVGLSP